MFIKFYKFFGLIILLTISIMENLAAQNDYKHILESFPNWRTNFNKKSIDLNEIMSGGPPKDGIPAILNPKFISINKAGNWLDKNEPVISIQINGVAKAYPLQILMFHEIVNDQIDGTPILVSFCPLCYSGIIFDRRVGETIYSFGVSGLLRNSDMVMYDLFSESFWQQFTGEAIVGDLTGTKLNIIPSQIISFKQFSESYPDGIILSRETGFKRSYGLNPYQGYDDENMKPFLYRGESDGRLPMNSKVIGVKLGNTAKAYPYKITQNKNVINDVVGTNKIVVFHLMGTKSALDSRQISDSKDVGSTGVFIPIVDGKVLTFKFVNNKITDIETRSVWNITGLSIKGALKGKQLRGIPFGDYFYFAWNAFQPESSIYK